MPISAGQAFLVAQLVKNIPTILETWVWSLGQKDTLEKQEATHSSILAWRIPWTEEYGRLQSMGLQRVRHDWVTNTFTLVVLMLVAQSYLTLWDHIDCSPSVSSVHGIPEAKILEWVAISSSQGFSRPRDWAWVSCVSCTPQRFLTAEQFGKHLCSQRRLYWGGWT